MKSETLFRDRPGLKRFDLLLGSVVLSFLLLVAVIGSLIWLEQ